MRPFGFLSSSTLLSESSLESSPPPCRSSRTLSSSLLARLDFPIVPAVLGIDDDGTFTGVGTGVGIAEATERTKDGEETVEDTEDMPGDEGISPLEEPIFMGELDCSWTGMDDSAVPVSSNRNGSFFGALDDFWEGASFSLSELEELDTERDFFLWGSSSCSLAIA